MIFEWNISVSFINCNANDITNKCIFVHLLSIEIFLESQVFFVGSCYLKILLEGSQIFCRTLTTMYKQFGFLLTLLLLVFSRTMYFPSGEHSVIEMGPLADLWQVVLADISLRVTVTVERDRKKKRVSWFGQLRDDIHL